MHFFPLGLGGDVVRAAEAAQDVDADVAVGTVLVADLVYGPTALLRHGFTGAALPTGRFSRPTYRDDCRNLSGRATLRIYPD